MPLSLLNAFKAHPHEMHLSKFIWSSSVTKQGLAVGLQAGLTFNIFTGEVFRIIQPDSAAIEGRHRLCELNSYISI